MRLGHPLRQLLCAGAVGGLFILAAITPATTRAAYYGIQVLDSQSQRAVPLVKVRVNGTDYYTDSNGYVAIDDPAVLNQAVSVAVSSYGYLPGSESLQAVPGQIGQLPLVRTNRAERLYRQTGAGIYQHTVALGQPAPIDDPLINAGVTGQDSVQATVYRDKIYWFWGDTLEQVGFGNFRTSGATSELPGRGGLDPSAGVNLSYIQNPQGQTKQIYQQFLTAGAPGPIWTDGLFTVDDNTGRERLLAHFIRVKDFSTTFSLYDQGLALFNDATESFDVARYYRTAPTVQLGTGEPITPAGHSFRHSTGGEEYLYFGEAYPNIRVRFNWDDVLNIAHWEAFTPLRENTRYDAANPPLELDQNNAPVYGWKKNTDPLTTEMLEELAAGGHIGRADAPFGLVDFETGQNVRLHRASVNWNPFRRKWIMIGNQTFGNESFLGEVWYAEAPTPEGPWKNAIKIATHNGPTAGTSDDYTFYNPTQLPFFDEDGGRIIYFQGTYSNTFSGNSHPTPRYDYNQITYRLDLATLPVLSSEVPAADWNADGWVDEYDLRRWEQGLGVDGEGDATGDSITAGNDLLIWQRQFGGSVWDQAPTAAAREIPEPCPSVLVVLGLLHAARRRAERCA
jgi:hypothetical protein